MKKIYCPEEIDFVSGECSNSFESLLSFCCEKVKKITNPYVGNKRKILFNIVKTIEDEGIKYDSILDLFGGSACVSMVMKMLGKRVIYNDLLKSSYYYGLSFIENNQYYLNKKEIEYLLNESDNIGLFVEKNYLDRFTINEARFLDSYRENVLYLKELYEDKDLWDIKTQQIKEALAFSSLQLYVMDKCFVGGRLNRGQILAEMKHRISHKRNNGSEMSFKNIKYKTFIVKDNAKENKAYNMDALDLLSNKNIDTDVDLAYIDPPYGNEMSDYCDMYSFFENYLNNRVVVLSDKDKFSKSKGYEKNFVELLRSLEHIPVWVISYNDSSWSGIKEIKNIIYNFRKNVKEKEMVYNYKYRKIGNGKEYLIIAK
jgi:adenine-specific DNA methylase